MRSTLIKKTKSKQHTTNQHTKETMMALFSHPISRFVVTMGAIGVTAALYERLRMNGRLHLHAEEHNEWVMSQPKDIEIERLNNRIQSLEQELNRKTRS